MNRNSSSNNEPLSKKRKVEVAAPMAVVPKRIEKETQKLQQELPEGIVFCKPTEENYRY